jgi:hypothetical protein
VFYDESFLMAMALAIGKPIKVDMHTLNIERGCFACICIEIDLDQPWEDYGSKIIGIRWSMRVYI